jgi:hypothetical protein
MMAESLGKFELIALRTVLADLTKSGFTITN